MMRDYTKMEEYSMQQQIIITGLEQTCQDLKEQHVVTHIEFEREKINSNYPNLGLERSV
jgi:hypothetical protein